MFVNSEPSPLDISFPEINSRFKQALVNFRLKSFFVITLVQSKQICSFDRRRRNAHRFDYFGRSEWNRFFLPFNSGNSTCNLRYIQNVPVESHATPQFWCEMQMKTLQARLANLSRPKQRLLRGLK